MVKIIQGSIKKFTVRLTLASSGDPLDLTSATEISTCLKNADASELMLSLTGGEITVLDAILGKIQVSLTEAQTALLGEVDEETLEIGVDLGLGLNKLQITKAYSVLPTIC